MIQIVDRWEIVDFPCIDLIQIWQGQSILYVRFVDPKLFLNVFAEQYVLML